MRRPVTSAGSRGSIASASIFQRKFMRNPLGRLEQERIREAGIIIVGLGGTGGFMLECLARIGAERLLLFDDDRIGLSNFNRQLLANDDTIDMKKCDAAAARVRSINKSARVELRGRFDKNSRLDFPHGGTDIILDGTDNIESKILLARKSRSAGLPFVFCSASGSRGIVSVFRDYPFRKAFQLPSARQGNSSLKGYRRCVSVICPAAAIAGSLAASQALNVLLSRPYTEAPEAVFFDLFRQNQFWISRLG